MASELHTLQGRSAVDPDSILSRPASSVREFDDDGIARIGP